MPREKVVVRKKGNHSVEDMLKALKLHRRGLSLSIEALDLAKASGVTILTLHPHTTSKLQPLHVGLNAPFKTFYNNAIDSWMLRNPGKSLTIYNVAECMGTAYAKVMTPVNIAAAFKKCGIFPYNRDIFTDIDFLPSKVTDRPQEEKKEDATTPAEDSDATYCESPTLISEDAPTLNPRRSTTPEKTIFDNANSSPKSLITPAMSRISNRQFVSPKQFMPPLKSGPRSSTRKRRKAGKSRIATDTPEKNQIMMDRQKKQDKTKVQGVKRAVLKEKNVEMKVPKKRKHFILEESSSEEEMEEVILMSETDLSEINDSGEEDVVVISGNFQNVPRKPVEGDYVLVIFDLKKNKVFYVAKVIEVCSSNSYWVSYMRVKNKERMKFFMPLEPDMAEVKLADI